MAPSYTPRATMPAWAIRTTTLRRMPTSTPGERQLVLVTWFIDRDGQEDCLMEEIGLPFPANDLEF